MAAKLLFLLSLGAADASVYSTSTQEVVVAASAARPAIARILAADNLDVDRLPATQVAELMDAIPRGAAPHEFWTAYRNHVRAWKDFARAIERSRRGDQFDIDAKPDGAGIASARHRINSSFAVVEAIARRHNAWPPRIATRF